MQTRSSEEKKMSGKTEKAPAEKKQTLAEKKLKREPKQVARIEQEKKSKSVKKSVEEKKKNLPKKLEAFRLPDDVSESDLTEVSVAKLADENYHVKLLGVCCEAGKLRTFKYKSGEKKGQEGYIFSFIINDEDGETIRCTAFNDLAELCYAVVRNQEGVQILNPAVKDKNADYDKKNPTTSSYEIQIAPFTVVRHVNLDVVSENE